MVNRSFLSFFRSFPEVFGVLTRCSMFVTEAILKAQPQPCIGTYRKDEQIYDAKSDPYTAQ